MKRLLSTLLLILAPAFASAQAVSNRGVIVKDEGTQQGFARSVDFVGSTVSCGISGGQATCTFTAATVDATTMSAANYAADAGGSDAYVITLAPAPSSWTTGLQFCFKANTANTLTATINPNGLGAKTIKRVAPTITTDLLTGDILANQIVCGIYDGTNFLVLNQMGNVQLFDGAAGVPSLGWSTTGFWRSGGNIYTVSAGGNWFIFNTAINLPAASPLVWTSGAYNAGTDTGIGRHAAGVIKATNSSSEIRGFLGGGAAVASATAMPLPTGRVFHVTGTTTITSITSTNFASGAVITLIFDGVLTFTDGSNLKLAGNLVTAADTTITLVYDGTNWYETSRSVN